MTSPLVPTAKLNLDGKDRALRMDLNALTDFESMTGKSIMRGGLTDIANLEMNDVRALLWACLVQEDESITIRDVGRWIHIGNIGELTETLAVLVSGSMPEPSKEDADDTSPLTTTSPSAPPTGGLDSTPPPASTSE